MSRDLATTIKELLQEVHEDVEGLAQAVQQDGKPAMRIFGFPLKPSKSAPFVDVSVNNGQPTFRYGATDGEVVSADYGAGSRTLGGVVGRLAQLGPYDPLSIGSAD